MRSWTLDSSIEIALGEVHEVKALLMRGGVRVLGTDDTQARLAVSEIDDCPLSVVLDDGVLDITNGPVSAARLLASSLPAAKKHRAVVTLSVPRTCVAELSCAVESSVLIAGLSGAVTAHVGVGDLVLARLSGPVSVDNARGRVEVMDVSGPTRIRSVSGAVTAAHVAGSLRAETVSGPISVWARPGVGANIQLATIKGAIHVGVAELRDCRVELDARSVGVSSEFPELLGGEEHGSTVNKTLGVPMWHLWARSVSGPIAVVGHDPVAS